jgi:hypothetical protein
MNKKLLKRADIMEWVGLSVSQFRKLVDARVLKPIRLRGYKQNVFRRGDVVKALQLEPES